MNYLAEQNVIGSLLMDADCISQITNELSADMFGSELLGRIYLEFQRAYDNNKTLTLPRIIQAITDYPHSIVMDEIKQCTVNTVTSATIKDYAEVICKEYKAKQFGELLNHIQVNPASVDKQIGDMITSLEAMQESRRLNSKSISEIAKEQKGKYFTEQMAERLTTGFAKLDSILGGLEGGDMIVIGARPGVGKSALVTQITRHMSEQNKKVGFYNLEMKDKQVYERFVVSLSGIPLTRLRRAVSFLNDEKERFDRANEQLEGNDKIIVSSGSKTVSEIRSEVRHMDYNVIIIDYLQLLRADATYKGNRYAEVGAISKAIKALAMELNIPIIALSQLNRVSEGRETKEPTMAELREAGDIEQDASVIILMWNLDAEDRSRKGCKIEKQRQGETGKVMMKFIGEYMRFEEQDGEWKTMNNNDDCPFK